MRLSFLIPEKPGGRVKTCNQNIQKTLDLAKIMLELAQTGDDQRQDTGCGVLYGVIRDCAYKIIQLAEAEKRAHEAKGFWP
jgi:hypothetical protein